MLSIENFRALFCKNRTDLPRSSVPKRIETSPHKKGCRTAHCAAASGYIFCLAERKHSEFQRDEGTVLLGHGDRGGDRQHLIPVI